MKPKPTHHKPGRKRKPRSDIEAEQQALDASVRTRRRHISAKQRAFIARFVDGGRKDPYTAAKEVGIVRASDADKLVLRLSDLIEAEWLRRRMGQQMEVDEALQLCAEIARTDPDTKLRHSALRTVLEVHGVLTGQPRVDRKEAMRTIQQLVAAIKDKTGKVKVRAVERVLEAEMGSEEPQTSRLGTPAN
jgi:hypothetical protein